MDGAGGREDFYSTQEGNVATIIDRYKRIYSTLKGCSAQKIAIYYANQIDATHIVGITLK